MNTSTPPPVRRRPVTLRDIIIVRLVNAFWVSTFFQPDEFFQSLEPAWQLAFGSKSGAWLTWEWQHQLRSSLHPALFAAGYKLVDGFAGLIIPAGNPLRASFLIAAPRAIQAVFAAMGDWYTWRLAGVLYGQESNLPIFALLLQLVNPWQWYCSTRTFSNSLETTITVAALYYWPWAALLTPSTSAATKGNPKARDPLRDSSVLTSLRISLILAALAVVLRPTNVLIWATIASATVLPSFLPSSLSGGAGSLPFSSTLALVREATICGGLVLAISLGADRLYFGFWTFPPYRWLTFNVSKSLAVFYGRSPWHYYLLQGIPLLCTTSLFFVLPALYKPVMSSKGPAAAPLALRILSWTVGATVVSMSLISHKEIRFIYPLLPILTVLAAPRAAAFFSSTGEIPQPQNRQTRRKDKRQGVTPEQRPTSKPRIRNRSFLLGGLFVNMILGGYLSLLHQPAPLSVLAFLRHEYERIHPETIGSKSSSSGGPVSLFGPPASDELFALFLMPCHSTPWRSHLVYPDLRARALTCEPPLHTQPNTPERELYRDEADRFYDDPLGFLRGELLPSLQDSPPRYIVGFQGIEPWLEEFLSTTPEGKKLGFKLRRVWGKFNGFFNEDWRRQGKVFVWDTGVFDDAPRER